MFRLKTPQDVDISNFFMSFILFSADFVSHEIAENEFLKVLLSTEPLVCLILDKPLSLYAFTNGLIKLPQAV